MPRKHTISAFRIQSKVDFFLFIYYHMSFQEVSVQKETVLKTGMLPFQIRDRVFVSVSTLNKTRYSKNKDYHLCKHTIIEKIIYAKIKM